MAANTYRPSPTALLNPCADPIFKILFTDESNEAHQALTCFLSDILEKKVTDVVLQPNELSGEAASDKQSEFDINCKVDGKIANIEIQGKNDDQSYGKRVEYHVAHVLNHYTPKGTDWDEIPQVFQISVMNFVFDKRTERSINHYIFRNDEGRAISETLNVIMMELPKIRSVDDDITRLTNAQMWGKFFLYAPLEEKADYIQKLTEANGGIKMAFTVLKRSVRMR
ncbi:MAG: Rpn family recombination-promoting nuclease/putative transposase [Treponemataceae bacterium]|nr:Rpn family recombination-promoting nuclease/putative transposase [Treponemataceae bacterium]